MSRLFMMRWPGAFYAEGPVTAKSATALRNREREALRRRTGNPKAKLPRGFEVWETTRASQDMILENHREMQRGIPASMRGPL